MIIHHKNLSKPLQLVVNTMHRRFKKTNKTLLKDEIDKPNIKHHIPKKMDQVSSVLGVNVYSLFAKPSNAHIIYLHGGGYILSGNPAHAMYIRKLHKHTNHTVHYIDYPLAPEVSFKELVPLVTNVIASLMEEHELKEIILMGDSAGGGLALSVAKKLEEMYQINQIFLFSPWLDVSMTNPDILEIEGNDASLAFADLKDIGHLYAKDETTHPDASPLYHDFSHDHQIYIFTGTEDILYPDMVAFEKKFPKTTLEVYHGAPHAFAVFPFIKEGKAILEKITQIIQSKKKDD